MIGDIAPRRYSLILFDARNYSGVYSGSCLHCNRWLQSSTRIISVEEAVVVVKHRILITE